MTSELSTLIPFEYQDTLHPHWRMCGAAALRMVYLSLDLNVPQPVIWPRIARPDGGGLQSARTHLLAADAERRGLRAMVLQTTHPHQTLEQCLAQDVRVVLNQRMRDTSRAGHYTVLTSVDEWGVQVHDPQQGPDRSLTWEALVSLWRPNHPASEIAGQVMVAVWRDTITNPSCPNCHNHFQSRTPCNQCGSSMSLHPAPLGCTAPSCSRRTWRRLFCPSCDAAHTPAAGNSIHDHTHELA